MYTTKRGLLVTRNRYNDFSGYELADVTEADEQRKRVRGMFDFVALDLVRQQRQHLDRRAEHARLVREARPRTEARRQAREGEDDDDDEKCMEPVGDVARVLGEAVATPSGAAPDRAARAGVRQRKHW